MKKRGSFAALRIVSWKEARLVVRPDEGGAVIRVATRMRTAVEKFATVAAG